MERREKMNHKNLDVQFALYIAFDSARSE